MLWRQKCENLFKCMTLQQSKKNVLMLRLGKKKEKRVKDKMWTGREPVLSYIPQLLTFLDMCRGFKEIARSLLSYLACDWCIGALFSLLFQYLFCSLTPPDLLFHRRN